MSKYPTEYPMGLVTFSFDEYCRAAFVVNAIICSVLFFSTKLTIIAYESIGCAFLSLAAVIVSTTIVAISVILACEYD